MIVLLDTNVLSELVRQRPDPVVLEWLDSRPARTVGTTTITIAELRYGVERLPDGRRKTLLASAVDQMLTADLDGRVADFDLSAARQYALVATARERSGRPISTADAQIAGICRARGALLATRNTKDFAGTGVDLVDPFEPDAAPPGQQGPPDLR
ncbi:MAG: type II toxin-antitoxin system VapC family toxin [Kineosporiaceae bacterium]